MTSLGPLHRKLSGRATAMSQLVWDYEGGADGKKVPQCVRVGDKVHDDMLGEGTAVRIDGGHVVIEFVEDGERIEKPRTKGHVRPNQGGGVIHEQVPSDRVDE
jgi:hypothetical protein